MPTRAERGAAAQVVMSGGDRLQVDVLGPIRARLADGRDVTPDGVLQRRLLALLVLRRGHVVSVDAAIDVAVAGRPPRDPVAALHNHLFRLRRACPTTSSSRRATATAWHPSAIDLDADRLARRAERRRPGRSRRARRRSTRSSSGGTARPTRSSTTSTTGGPRRSAWTSCGSARWRRGPSVRLAAGATDGLVVELAALADEEPLRERPRALLMAALAGAGSQRRGAARLRRLPAPARRRARHRAVAGRWPPSTPTCSWHGYGERGRRRAGCPSR